MRALLGVAMVLAVAACSSGTESGVESDSSADDAVADDDGLSDAIADAAPEIGGDVCHAIPSSTCNDCLKTSCCASLLACLADSSCAACAKDPNAAGCDASALFGPVRACARTSCNTQCSTYAPPSPTCETGKTCSAPGAPVMDFCSDTFTDGTATECCPLCAASKYPGCPPVVQFQCCTLSGEGCNATTVACCGSKICQIPAGSTKGTCADCFTLGTSCSGTQKCCSGLTCSGGACRANTGETCFKNSDCIAPNFCYGNRCHEPLYDGYACKADVECKSGACISGYCKSPCDPKTCSGTSCYGGECFTQYCSGFKCCVTDSFGTSCS